jgi:eukaryotic translation initiation factor 2C
MTCILRTKPGTGVDRAVTEAQSWDLFLQAHAALQGTARPYRYHIVHNVIFQQIYAKLVPPQYQNVVDVVEDLTHSMCYLFGRATKAVSLCPPAYYADLACERARCHLSSFFRHAGGECSNRRSSADEEQGGNQALTRGARINAAEQ